MSLTIAAAAALAQTTQLSPSPWEWVLSFGTVGSLTLFLYGFKVEWWVTGEVYRLRVEEAREYRAALDRHRDRLETETVPLLVRAADALTEVAELLPRSREGD